MNIKTISQAIRQTEGWGPVSMMVSGSIILLAIGALTTFAVWKFSHSKWALLTAVPFGVVGGAGIVCPTISITTELSDTIDKVNKATQRSVREEYNKSSETVATVSKLPQGEVKGYGKQFYDEGNIHIRDNKL